MGNNKLITFEFILVFLFVALCASCSHLKSRPPSAETMDRFVIQNTKDLSNVVDYLLNYDANSVNISSSDGSALSDFERVVITDEPVLASVRTLWQNGCINITKDVERNEIIFMIWKRSMDEADCGIVFALNNEVQPEVQFQTELIPLSENGWYYYLAEYNKWRASSRAG